MNPIRQDLLQLTADALTALANAGFVKRAFKDIAEGRMPNIAVDTDGTISAAYSDGQTAKLEAGKTLRDAVCSCPASGLCKHKVTLIPAYQYWAKQQTPDEDMASDNSIQETISWSPADIAETDLQQVFKPAIIKHADMLAKKQMVIKVCNVSEHHPVPTAYLPMSTVRFFSSQNLAHARCDCIDGSVCVHVILAIRAFGEAKKIESDFQVLTVTLGGDNQNEQNKIFVDKADDAVHATEDLLMQIWSDGVSQSPLILESRFTLVKNLVQKLKWQWVTDSIETIEQMINAYHRRSSRFEAKELMKQMAFLSARLISAQYADNNPQTISAAHILGIGIAGEMALDHLSLIGLGTELWEDDDQEGFQSYFIDPDTQTLTTLERSWKKNATSSHEQLHSVLHHRVSGLSVEKISQSQIITSAASRKANGIIQISANTRHTNAMPLSAQSWAQLNAPLRQNNASTLINYLRSQPPEFIQPRQAISQMAILPVTEVIDWYWDAGEQKIYAWLNSGLCSEDEENLSEQQDLFQLVLPYQNISRFAISNLADALEHKQITLICGMVVIEQNQIKMHPLALVADNELIVLATKVVNENVLKVDNDYQQEKEPVLVLFNEVWETFSQYLIQGIRYQSAGIRQQLNKLSECLGYCGAGHCAQLISQFEHSLFENNPKEQMYVLNQLILLLDQLK